MSSWRAIFATKQISHATRPKKQKKGRGGGNKCALRHKFRIIVFLGKSFRWQTGCSQLGDILQCKEKSSFKFTFTPLLLLFFFFFFNSSDRTSDSFCFHERVYRHLFQSVKQIDSVLKRALLLTHSSLKQELSL